MSWIDIYVAGREALLNRLLKVNTDRVLNAAPAGDGSNDLLAIVTEMKQAINGFRATAVLDGDHQIDYARLRQSDIYQMYRSECSPKLRSLDLKGLQSTEERLAFWINLYNALVVDAVISFGVRQSVVEGRFGLPRFFRQAAYNVGGYRFSCDDIEHGVLRSNVGHPAFPGPHFATSDPRRNFVLEQLDPRIHFALNCASRSCPPIGVYEAEQIHQQLDRATQSFIASETAIKPEQREIHVSAIFRWYARDFGGTRGIIRFLLTYLPEGEISRWLTHEKETARLVYDPYDWALNSVLN